MKPHAACWILVVALAAFVYAQPAMSTAPASSWPPPVAPLVKGATGFVVIPGAAVRPMATRPYRAVFDATRGAADPKDLTPAIDMAGSELNALGASGVPIRNVKFVLVFHEDAANALLDDAHYRQRFGVTNPNLKVLADMKKLGVEIYVCGQYLAINQIDPATLTPDVIVAADALIALMQYQADGYALLSF